MPPALPLAVVPTAPPLAVSDHPILQLERTADAIKSRLERLRRFMGLSVTLSAVIDSDVLNTMQRRESVCEAVCLVIKTWTVTVTVGEATDSEPLLPLGMIQTGALEFLVGLEVQED